MSEKQPKKPAEAANADSHKPRIGQIFGYMAQNAIPRAPSPPATPTFCGFHPSELPKRTPRPQYLGPLGCGKLQAQAQRGGCPNGSTGSSRGKKMTFLKNDPRPCACNTTVGFVKSSAQPQNTFCLSKMLLDYRHRLLLQPQ